MDREPIHPDDLRLTAYALGEMTSSERAEFEAQLAQSPIAEAELAAMDETIALLSGALETEWCREMKQPALSVLPTPERDAKVVEGQFRRTPAVLKYSTAVAAAVVGIAALVAFLPGGSEVPTSIASSEPGTVSGIETVQLSPSGISVPELYLTEAVGNPENLDLASALESLDRVDAPVDASYLDSSSLVPSGRPGLVTVAHRSDDRVDSYLDVDAEGLDGIRSGLIERRRAAIQNASDSRAFVRGYVSMDGGESMAQEDGRVLVGFRPVSMVGNPVRENEWDLRILSDMQSFHNDLSRIVDQLPEHLAERDELSRLVERNAAVVSELKQEISRK